MFNCCGQDTGSAGIFEKALEKESISVLPAFKGVSNSGKAEDRKNNTSEAVRNATEIFYHYIQFCLDKHILTKEKKKDEPQGVEAFKEMMSAKQFDIGIMVEFIFANSDEISSFMTLFSDPKENMTVRQKLVKGMLVTIDSWITSGRNKITPKNPPLILDLQWFVETILKDEHSQEEQFNKAVKYVIQNRPNSLYLGTDKKKMTLSTVWFVGLVSMWQYIVRKNL